MNLKGSHRLWGLAVLAALLLSETLASDVSNLSAQATYHSNVREVRLVFYATDEHDRGVDQLTRRDVAVVDNERVVRNFRSFSRSDDVQPAIILLIDTSESVASSFQQRIADIVELTTQLKEIPTAQVSLLSFGNRPTNVICDGDCLTTDWSGKLLDSRTTGQTPLFDALIFAARFATQHRRRPARPVIILFSDGEDTISRHSATEASEAAIASEAVLYAVDLAGSRSRYGRGTLQSLARGTGGRYFSPDYAVARVLSSVLEDLHASYAVTYQLPEREDGFHAVQVLPTQNLSLQFRCRSGYYYSERKP